MASRSETPHIPDDLPKRTRDLLRRLDAALVDIDTMLLRLARQGLQWLDRASVSELEALAKRAQAGRLHALRRELERLATLVGHYLDRDPLFERRRYRATLNRVWLLVRRTRQYRLEGALPDEMLEVVGEARRSYEPVDAPLELQAIGAHGWVTDTDYVGITVYFCCAHPDLPDVLEVSNAKPCQYFGRNPRDLLTQRLSDGVRITIQALAHGAFTFRNAKVSRDGRLSLHKHLRIDPAPWRGGQAYDAFAVDSWNALVERLRATHTDPVRPGSSVLCQLAPHTWGELAIDRTHQVARLPVRDRHGLEIELRVAMRDENNRLIDNLEIIAPRGDAALLPDGLEDPAAHLRPDLLFGRVRVDGGRLVVAPMTAIYRSPIVPRRGAEPVHEVHLGFETLEVP